MTGGPRSAALAALACLVAGSPMAGQVSGTLGLGASMVEFDGYLASGAVVLAPAVRFDTPSLSLGGQASWSVFESGNEVFQGLAAASWLVPSRGRLRLELAGSAGASRYAGEQSYGHLLGGARLHLFADRAGGWVGITSGGSFYDATSLPVELSVGGWRSRGSLTLAGSATGTVIDGDRYVDLSAAVRWTAGAIELEARAGARPVAPAARGFGTERSSVYGEVSALVPLGDALTLTFGGGSFPADPTRRILAARYASAGVRLALGREGPRPRTVRPGVQPTADLARTDRGAARLDVAVQGDSTVLRVHVPGARSVELMADFTDWAAVPLVPAGRGVWETRLQVEPGIYRLNVRIDGGSWLVPAGTRAERTEFGGSVGIVLIER